MLECDKSTIIQELRRNQGLKDYHPKQAQELAMMRRVAKAAPRIDSKVWDQV